MNYSKIPKPSGEYGIGACFTGLNVYHLRAHWCHLNTSSYPEHKALDFLGDGIDELKDEILEKLLGYFPKESQCSINVELKYSIGEPTKLAEELRVFAQKYYKIFEDMGYSDLSNLMADLEGVASKTKYLLTLK